MKRIIYGLFFGFIGSLLAQNQVDTLNRPVTPSKGVTGIVVKYYEIEFSKEQRESLKDIELELIFSVDPQGVPTLAEVNGTTDAAIVDSLQRKTAEIPPFLPQLEQGQPVSALYFVKFQFPRYGNQVRYERLYLSSAYLLAKREDFEYLNKTFPAAFFQFRASGIQPLGKLSSYVTPGGGLALDVFLVAPNRLVGGVSMEPYLSKRTRSFPIQSPNIQSKNPSSIFISLNAGKQFPWGDLRADVGVYTLNITESNGGSQDTGFVSIDGWSFGMLYDYTIQLGIDVPARTSIGPSVNSYYLDFQVGIRQVFATPAFASGPILTLGMGFRLGIFTVESYKFKDEYLQKIEKIN